MTLPALEAAEAALAEANAKVAEVAYEFNGAYGQHGRWELEHLEKLRHALLVRTDALAALAAARRPQLMSPREAVRFFDSQTPKLSWVDSFGAVLIADRERCVKVGEAALEDYLATHPDVQWISASLAASILRTALLGAGSKG